MANVIEKLLSRAIVTDRGCWEWQGARSNDYGVVSIDGKDERVHRVAFKDQYGWVPDVLDHVECDNPPCFNPDHLAPATHRQNLLRSELTLAGRNARKTTCVHGHPLVAVRGRPANGARRHCPECGRAKSRRHYEKVRRG